MRCVECCCIKVLLQYLKNWNKTLNTQTPKPLSVHLHIVHRSVKHERLTAIDVVQNFLTEEMID
jgi:hypothetical protein